MQVISELFAAWRLDLDALPLASSGALLKRSALKAQRSSNNTGYTPAVFRDANVMHKSRDN